ncbi:AMP-binding protein [Pseudomonas cremoricolorata]|uniref:AMP-binding protein n=1 Tax=Pseudomonas cremoricolorata TaxID=157783 RepID=UPI0003F8BFD6|nr:AMP-binding protein [Pseudomonas cremoricolorata]
MSPELEQFHQRLRGHAQRDAHAVALLGDQRQVSYAELLDEVERRRLCLRERGARVVALLLDNGIDAMLWDLAVLFEGLACVTLPGFFTAAQRSHCLARSGCDVVIAEPALDDELRAAGYRPGPFWQRPVAPGQLLPGTAKLTFTSGTTGTPKGVCLSAASVLGVAQALHQASAVNAPRQHLALLPLAVLLENIGGYAALLAGACLSLPSLQRVGLHGASGVDAPRLFALLAESRPHSLILVPQLLQLLVLAAEQGAFDPRGLRFVAVGGAKVSASLLARAQRVGLPLYEGYGLSECASVVCLNRPQAQRSGSVGLPLPHVQVRLAEDGEVLVKGATLLGYLGEPAPAEGWWPTGDLGWFDADGYLFLRGRKKHQFITSFGRNVNPEWVEAELSQGGVIAQALVHGEAQAHNHALLWPHDPAISDQHLAEAVARANQGLPDYAQVHRWSRLNEPFSTANGLLTSNGRLRRDAIIERYRALLSATLPTEDITP